MRRALVTGGAGFIGSHLADALVAGGVEVALLDNLSTGRRDFAEPALRAGATLHEADVHDEAALCRAMDGCDTVFHLQANADVRRGLERPRRDLEQNTIATSNVLEAMRATGARRILFASTGSVYGEPRVFPTPEDAPFPVQTSLYAASKLAGEGLLSAYAHGYGIAATAFRFVSILGPRYTHGHVVDFVEQLRRHPDHLDVLGDGGQTKSYLDVADCVAAILTVADGAVDDGSFGVYNLGTDETVTVDESIATITAHLGLEPDVRRGAGRRGWVGDSPLIHLDTRRIRALGWAPRTTIRTALRRTVDWLTASEPVAGAGA